MNIVSAVKTPFFHRFTLAIALFSATGYTSADITSQSTTQARKDCIMTPLKKSHVMIQHILDDISETYTHSGGGGITQIQLSATDTYSVSIAQEERIDQITYTLTVDDSCTVKTVNKEVSAISPWEK